MGVTGKRQNDNRPWNVTSVDGKYKSRHGDYRSAKREYDAIKNNPETRLLVEYGMVQLVRA